MTLPRLNKGTGTIALLAGLAALLALAVTMTRPAEAQWNMPTDSSLPKVSGLWGESIDSPGVVQLEWTAPVGRVDGYRIMRKRMSEDNQMERLVSNTNSTSTRFTDTKAGTGEVKYKIAIIRDNKLGPMSDVVTVTVRGTVTFPATFPATKLSAAEEELKVLAQTMDDHLAGCFVFETDQPNGVDTGHDGYGYWRVNTDNAKCVPMAAVIGTSCVNKFIDGGINDKKVTVARSDNELWAYIGTTIHNRINLFDYGTPVSPIMKPIQRHEIKPDGLIEGHHIYFLRGQGPNSSTRLSIDETRIIGLTDYSPSDGSVEGNTSYPDQIGAMLTGLDELVDQIVDGEDYYSPPNCLFDDDVRDTLQDLLGIIHESWGTASINSTTTGYLDVGRDADVFEAQLDQGVVYQIYVAALDSDDIDLADLADLTGYSGHKIGTALVKWTITDANGNELASGADGDPVSYTPSNSELKYLHVEHATDEQARSKTAGVYEITVRDRSSEAGVDYSDDINTFGFLTTDDMVTGALGANGDKDWFKAMLDADQTYVIHVEPNHAESDPLDGAAVRFYDSDGNALPDDRSGSETDGDVTYGEVRTTYAGVHYAEVSQELSGDATGAYVVSLRNDDHGHVINSATVLTGGTTGQEDVTGAIDWTGDSDRFVLSLPNNQDWIVNLTGENGTIDSELTLQVTEAPDAGNPTVIIHGGGGEYGIDSLTGWQPGYDPNPETIKVYAKVAAVAGSGAEYKLTLTSGQIRYELGNDSEPGPMETGQEIEDLSNYLTVVFYLDGDSDVDSVIIRLNPGVYNIEVTGPAGTAGLVSEIWQNGSKVMDLPQYRLIVDSSWNDTNTMIVAYSRFPYSTHRWVIDVSQHE